MDTNERDDMSPESEQEMPDKILGMDADKFMAGYAEMQSEEAEFKEFGFIPTKDYTDTPGMNFLVDLVGDEMRRLQSLPKIANPSVVKSTAEKLRVLHEIFDGKKTAVRLDSHPNTRGSVGIILSGKKIVVERDNFQDFLSVASDSFGIDVEAHVNGNAEITIGIKNYWRIVGVDED